MRPRPPESRPESPTRDRTRRALLAAGIAVLAAKPTATTGDIASHAGVARSTLHRYFQDRAALVRAVDEFVETQYEEALAAASIHEGTGYEAYTRVVDELLGRIEPFSWWMQTVHAEVDDYDSDPDRELLAVIQRGQADGTIDTQFPPAWIHTVTWATLWSAHKQVTIGGQRRQPIREATRATLSKIARA